MDAPAAAVSEQLEDVPLSANYAEQKDEKKEQEQQEQKQELAKAGDKDDSARSDDVLDELENIALPSLAKVNSRTNSLKRFFKMNKKGEKESTSPNTTGGAAESTDEENLKSKSENNFSKVGKKFNLRLGHFKSATHQTTSADGESPKPSSPEKKHSTLKGSLSNYWNSLFKKGKKGTASDADGDSGSSSNSDADDEVDVPKRASKQKLDKEQDQQDAADNTADDTSSVDNAIEAATTKEIPDNLTSVANEIHALNISEVSDKEAA